MHDIVLKKSGFWVGDVLLSDELDILNAWNCQFLLEDITFGDVLDYLRSLNNYSLEVISKLVNANISAYLCDVVNPDGIETEIESIEVKKYFEISDYYGPLDIQTEICACGLGNNETYGLEFTSWDKLKHIPVKLGNPCNMVTYHWEKCEPRGVCKNSKTGEFLFETDRELVTTVKSEVNVTYTVGEFLIGLFNDLCFFGTPEEAQDQFDTIVSRIDEIKRKDLN